MKLIILLSLILTMVSCSHHHKKPTHHHHQFDKKCAYEVSQNHFNVEGKDEFQIEHGGQTYYFSNAENMKKFQNDLDASVKKANENWKHAPPSSYRR